MTKILGISGFENSVPFKKLHWPGLEEREYRISQGHDSAAVVIVDGEIVAGTAEERLNRKKHSADFPIGAIRYCLDKANLRIEEIDEIAHGFDYTPYKALYSMDPAQHSAISGSVFPRAVARRTPPLLSGLSAGSRCPGESSFGPCCQRLFHLRMG